MPKLIMEIIEVGGIFDKIASGWDGWGVLYY
jgi:hypothetical protein